MVINMKKRFPRIFGIIIAFSLCFGLNAAAVLHPFTDVPAGSWYSNDVSAAYNTGLFAGTSDTTFSPNGTLTISQTTALAARIHQYVHTGSTHFESGAGVWYTAYVDYAKKNGIIGNAYDGRWDENATRAEVVQILYNALDVNAYTVMNSIDDNAVPDVKSGTTAYDEIYAFYRAGILTGDASHRFNPRKTITRCEVAAILNRMLDPSQRQGLTLSAPVMPAYDAPVTRENILAVLDSLDPDGAYIIRATSSNSMFGDTLLSWWDSFGGLMGNVSITDRLATAVHEECHMFTSYDFFSDRFYIGNGESVSVRRTNVFDSAEMTATIPEALRTFRFNTYVGLEADALMSSRQFGVYGLMNEFTAYCWGTNNYVQTYDYRVSHGDRTMSNEWIAYAEFRYYILRYMLYAKANYPTVYQGILDNNDFCRAFITVDSIYAGVINRLHEKAGGYLYGQEEYDALMAEMAKPEYQEMMALLRL